MCGRFALTAVDPAALQAQFGLAEPPPALTPRYNIAPTQAVAVVANSQPRALTLMRWGLIPGWARDEAAVGLLINARAETAATKPAFRRAYQHQRCVVLVSGFYEWRRAGRTKTPHYIHAPEGGVLALAGLWEVWRGQPTCAILTTTPNDWMRPIHDRMPVIVPPTALDRWLAPGPAAVDDLLGPCPADWLHAYPVAAHVNRATHDAPDCLQAA